MTSKDPREGLYKNPLDLINDLTASPAVREIETQVFRKIVERLFEQMNSQPWWKKYSNTVTTIVSGLVVLAGWITTTSIDLPDWAAFLVGVILFIGSVLGVRSTKNGLTESVITKVIALPESPVSPESSGRHRVSE